MTRLRNPYLDDGDVTVYAGDCIEVMREMPEASVDAVVTDPPYALNFMGKKWDSFSGNPAGRACEECGNDDPVVGYRLCLDCLEAFDEKELRGASMLGQVSQNWSDKATHSRGYADNNNLAFHRWTTLWAREAYRVLKPGGHLLAFAGTRTYHRMASGVEDAGFEIRDCIAWMYGSGFPKSLDVSKAIDKAAGAEREIVGRYTSPEGTTGPRSRGHNRNTYAGDNYIATEEGDGLAAITAPATEAAREWSGWGTALKPAFEPVVVARKPLTGTVAQNVLEHGTGAINVDGCRIAGDMTGGVWHGSTQKTGYDGGWDSTAKHNTEPHTAGRWPTNVTLDEDAAAMLDEQTPHLAKAWSAPSSGNASDRTYGGSIARSLGAGYMPQQYGDSGGASRFFYTAKASRQDRNVGGLADNTHPTVKPTDLMRWLIRLVTPPQGVILDPFGGSGSTGLAARAENVRCILIEREDEYLKIISDRLAQLSLLA